MYTVSWSQGKIFALRLLGHEGDFEVLDSVTAGGVGLNFIEVMPDCTSIQGACVCCLTAYIRGESVS